MLTGPGERNVSGDRDIAGVRTARANAIVRDAAQIRLKGTIEAGQ